MLKVGINGFGRIGRMVARVLFEREGVKLSAINDPTDARTLAHLLKYDSVHGTIQRTVKNDGDELLIDQEPISIHHWETPDMIPWESEGIDLVIEASGQFLTQEPLNGHLQKGVGRVILSAPPKDERIPMVVQGIDDDRLNGNEAIVSNASCTTNSAAPLIQLIDRAGGINSGYITTVHSYTMDQKLHDSPHKDLRRARAAAESIVPTTTGAAKAITKIFPQLDLKLGGCGIRVPVPDGSLTDITCSMDHEVSAEEIDELFKEAADGSMKGVLRYEGDPIVSRDVIGDPSSCIYDSQLTSVVGNLVKVVGWYDNEVGYSNRLVDLAEKLS